MFCPQPGSRPDTRQSVDQCTHVHTGGHMRKASGLEPCQEGLPLGKARPPSSLEEPPSTPTLSSSLSTQFALPTGPRRQPGSCHQPPLPAGQPQCEQSPSHHTPPSPNTPTGHFLSKSFTTRKQIRGNKNKQRANYQDKGDLL